MTNIMKKTILILTIFALLITPVAAKTFSDVEDDNPYFTAISYLSESEIIAGHPDGSFQPFANINRAELIKMLMEGSEAEIAEPLTNCFSDVPYTAWYAPSICAAKELGYISGYEDGTFQPSKSVNKVEAIKIIGEIYSWDIETEIEIDLYTDTPANEWYSPYLKYAKSKNLLPVAGETYYPGNEISRGSISETLYRHLATIEQGAEVFSQTIADSITASLEPDVDTNEETADDASAPVEITGLIDNALTGLPLSGATITLYDNQDNYVTLASSDAEGNFILQTPEFGLEYYLLISKEGYFTLQLDPSQNQIHSSLSPVFTQVDPENLRIVLTWGEYEVDLDAHLIKPSGDNYEEMFFMHKLDTGLNVLLDLDSSGTQGTETMTIRNYEEGEYEYFVHLYSGDMTFEETEARIEVYDENGLAAIYEAPLEAAGTIWRIFTMDGVGKITDVNQIGDCSMLTKISEVCP